MVNEAASTDATLGVEKNGNLEGTMKTGWGRGKYMKAKKSRKSNVSQKCGNQQY